ncbi:MAG: hypothetical protein CMB65_03120 [Euryarchaeota archaeon]|nr:hypothetical protein [Euryarchaeota archaeon]|tara:strand:- start:152 stop:538 length:387 start_codon:yes stop_codon:yes gene_type:complete
MFLLYLVHIANLNNTPDHDLFMSSETNFTIPATEENLSLEVDRHMMDYVSNMPLPKPSPPHSVIVDGIRGEAAIGSFGTWSTRLSIILEHEHPELGKEFMTKYFRFTEPGVVHWGHYGQSFRILKTIE